MRIGQYGGIDFPYFTKSNHFTKNHLLSYFKNDQQLRSYLPDDIRMDFIKRSYLLNVSIFYNILGIICGKKRSL